ncbi:EPL1 [Candida theae]|uniref:Enhancer of polycomb-like protein n=1 Tax=Candida theae TaxID=1198502 RepID=A0AAD5BCZ5_9ASCO|nr:EPL1 [Candida theae]KAI5954858.1 EPL1 [Candida theae]
MAIPPGKNESKANHQHAAAGARFRQRKISVKQPLSIYKQSDLPTLDGSDLEPSQIHHLNSNNIGQPPRDVHAVETGVDKNEEEEVHLQQVINAAQKALSSANAGKTNEVYIPTPDASKIWPEAAKYYQDQKFNEPETYIKFSATVEDTIGVEYNMDEEDDAFYNEVLSKIQPTGKKKQDDSGKCTELEFETICDRLEKTIEARQPFLSMDPSNILSYEEMAKYIIDQFESTVKTSNPYVEASGGNLEYLSTTTLKERLSKEINYKPFTTLFDRDQEHTTQTRPIPKLFELFGKVVYDHWSKRKIARKGKSVHPTLRFEDPNANEKDNENDPYICFRRREFRQARKTRRADTVGAERIRLLQKSLHRARDLVKSVCEREILSLRNLQAEFDIFKTRSEAKSVKRELGLKGDDYLFFPHKKRKIVKPKEDEEEKERKREKRRQEQEPAAKAHQQQNVLQQQNASQQNQREGTSTNQPYVKLPPSKVPDMDLVTVSLVLKEKNDTIRRAVLDKLRKRKEQDRGFVNVTDDPYEPFFDISTNDKLVESAHIPYSSIAATNYHQFNTSNYLSDPLKTLIEENKPLPGVRTFKGSNGELIPTKSFPHTSALLQEKITNNKFNSPSYIAQLLQDIENNNYDHYTRGFAKESIIEATREADENATFSEPILRLRKRVGRGGRVFLDRRGQTTSDVVDEFLDFSKICDAEEETPNVYDSKVDEWKRLRSRWMYDSDLSESQKGTLDPFSLDPSKLNNISDDTQAIRFGSMLLSKSYGLLKESIQQKQQSFMHSARMRALQQQQQQLANRQSQAQAQAQAQQKQLGNQSNSEQVRSSSPSQQVQKRSLSERKSTPNAANNTRPLSPAQNSINKSASHV